MAIDSMTIHNHEEFVSIPVIRMDDTPQEFSAFVPIVLMDGEYDESIGMSVGKSIGLAPVSSEVEALEAARVACLSMDGAIGYGAKGVRNE